MKKLLISTAICLTALSVQAQMYPNSDPTTYSYGQDRIDQGYHPPVGYQNGGANGNGYYGNGNAVTASATAAPASAQFYGFYQHPARSTAHEQQRQMMWYPTKQQRAAANGQVYANPVYAAESDEQPQNVYRSPVYNSKAMREKKDYYVDLHLGVGGTLGWKGNVDDPVSPVWGIAVGTRVTNRVRVDAEFAYHMQAKLTERDHHKVEYKQYELGGNIYYDFPVNAALRFKPFVGAGLWGVKGKANASKAGIDLGGIDSGIKLGVSVAGGIIYPINDMFSFVAMARGRYIATDDALYNLEGLIGVRYHF